MPITRKIEDENLVVTIFSGQVSHHELMQSLDELVKIIPNLSALYELAINTDELKIETSNEMAEKIINKASDVFNTFERAIIAIVSPTDFIFGFARRFGTSIVNEKINISVFRTEKTVRIWIDEIRSLHNSINRII